MSSSQTNDVAWESKQISIDDVPHKIPNGSNLYIGSCASTPEAVLTALVESPRVKDIQIHQLLPGGTLPHLREDIGRFRTSSFFSMSKTIYQNPEELHTLGRPNEGLADYRPMGMSSVPRLLQERSLTVDIAVIKVSAPNKGFCCLGPGVEHTRAFVEHATTVIAEVTTYMPWTEGHSKIRIEDIDFWLFHDEPLKTTDQLWPEYMKYHREHGHPQAILDAIGQNVVKLIPSKGGATLRFGWSPITHCVCPFLHLRQNKNDNNLHIHSDVYTEAMFRLQEQGTIRSVLCSHAHGSQDLYNFLDRNPAIEFHSTSYTSDPQVLGKVKNLIVIEGGLKVRYQNH